ncbi:uncharacterized protein LOC132628293 [Lycium barbarum]|uniref:uncharacterized protein LOC132628293 n=1 Tax=Lycium barbarum TaxID=112863 RepID=UPI00293E3CAB|nr:uncharacterized protein LOC132628293 [Lycium barbarum]
MSNLEKRDAHKDQNKNQIQDHDSGLGAKISDTSQQHVNTEEVGNEKEHPSDDGLKKHGFDIKCDVYANDDQMLTCKICHNNSDKDLFISTIYAKSRSAGRVQLWEHMRAFAYAINHPWMMCGDFNCIVSPEEKYGGTPHKLSKSLDFIECITDCGLADMGHSGNTFTWCNERKEEEIIWKRLDKMIANDEIGAMFPSISVQHLARVSSDHCPLLINLQDQNVNNIKYFKFLNFWTEKDDFQDLVKEHWNQRIDGNIFWIIQQKMKRVSKALSDWSRNKIGDIFIKTSQLEEYVSDLEEIYRRSLAQDDRMTLNKTKADLVLHLKTVDAYWIQKAHLKWKLEGDENTKYFHSVVRGRRHHMKIHRIQNGDDWLDEEDHIANAAVEFYQDLFSQSHAYIDLSKCWDIVDKDMINMVRVVLKGHPMPKYFTRTCLVLIPKVQHPQEFSEYRPISLSNVTHKIVSKVLNNRLSKVLLNIISQNHSGFMNNRAMGENVLLAQEIVHEIRKPNKGGNVVIKLDMNKAYDRISWNFICAVMRKMGFSCILLSQMEKEMVFSSLKVVLSKCDGKYKYHWSAWSNFCLPTNEGEPPSHYGLNSSGPSIQLDYIQWQGSGTIHVLTLGRG